MILLPKTLNAWGTKDFVLIFKQEVSGLDMNKLPLQQALSLSSYVSNEKISALVNRSEALENRLIIHAGIFYSGIIAGCSCSDDPTPIDTQNEYCEVIFTIDNKTAQTTVSLKPD